MLDARTIQVTWSPPASPNEPIVSYSLARNATVVYYGPLITFTDINLEPLTTYSYIITAFNDFGSTASSSSIATTMLDVPTGVPEPMVTDVTAQTANFTWGPPAIPNGLIVNCSLVTSNHILLCESLAYACQATSLFPFTTYSVSARCCTVRACGQSHALTFQTSQSVPSGLSAPSVLFLNSTAVLVTWRTPAQPNGVIQKYDLYVQGVFSEPWVSGKSLSLSDMPSPSDI